jgi:CHAT domain-containing protein
MKKFRPVFFLLLIISLPVVAQNKKIDKSLKKIDKYYAEGNLMKASSGLKSLKSSVAAKMGASNTYMPGLYLREARMNLALGLLSDFDNILARAITESINIFGENSKSYATMLLEVALIYNEYGNFRIAREYVEKSRAVLSKTEEIEEPLRARMALIEAEAMIGQGFCHDALALLNEYEKYFASRAVEKESIVENGQIKSRYVPETEIYERFNSYVTLRILKGQALAQMGRISMLNVSAENPDVDYVFNELRNSFPKSRFLGETSLSQVRYQYIWTKTLVENGLRGKSKDKDLTFAENLSDLKKITSPTNALAHDIYLSYLAELLKESGARYINVKLEYQKVMDKYFPKTSLHKINLNAVEFNSKLARDKTRDLENQAFGLITSKSLPANYKTTILVYQFLYDIALAERKYGNAEGYLKQIAETQKELCGENSPRYHLALLKLANFYLDYTNKIDEAGKIYKESYFDLVAGQIGEQHKDRLDILNHIAQWYELTDRYADASKTLSKAEDALRVKFDNQDILYAHELNHIAALQLKLGEYDLADKNLNTAFKITEKKKSLSEWPQTQVGLLETQAKLFAIKGMFDEAESSLASSKKIADAQQKKDKSSTIALSSAQELAPLYILLGKLTEAEKTIQQQIPEYTRLYGPESTRLIEPLINQSRILLARGDYTEAEKTALRANRIAIQTYSEISTKTAPTQKILSDIYFKLGDYQKAEDQVTKALRSQEKQFGRNHIEVAKSISQLALIKFHKGDNRKQVEQLMLESRDIMEEKLGKDNPQYAEILKNVAVLYISEKKFEIAFHSLTIAESIWSAKTGRKNNINLASIYTLTGDVYYQSKNYKKAEEFYNKSKALYENFFSANHPEYVRVLSKLSKVYYMQKDYKRSKRNIEEALSNYEQYIKQFFPALSEAEKAKYWNTIKGDFEFYNTLAFSNLDDFKDLAGKVYNYQLLTKALLLSSSIKIRERIMNSTDENLKNQYSAWIEKKELLSLALSMGPTQLSEAGIDPNALQQEVERLEKELSQKSELFGQSFESKRITYDDIKKILKPNEVAIEMVRYRHFNHTLTDSVIYAAIYMRNDIPRPRVIMFSDGRKMETRFFKYYRNCITGKLEDNVSYGVFWKPIQDGLGQTSTIYLSADGIFNQINLESIKTPDGKYILDNANIVLVSNTKDLYLHKVKTRLTNNENTASLFGNPTFYVSATGRKAISPLPGTEREVSQVNFMLNQKGWITREFVEGTASEENVKELNSPKVFHIATHGFYKTNDQLAGDALDGYEASLTRNPLLRTGLLLKGAGDLMEKTQHNFNIENGILTAYEAMNLNLDKTDLVVLSACETGLGDLEAGEGVYGLQRAFLVAGAKVLVMSMFKVDDDATERLMLIFYQKWQNSGNLRNSLLEAKKELRVQYPEPIYWGAFMMIGLE